MTHSPTRKVLVADDEESVVELLSAIFDQDPKYELIIARDGEEALDVARRQKPDVLFLDVLMPKRTGYEVCRILKSEPSTAKVKVVIFTALTREIDQQRAREAGADDFIAKPFSPTTILQKLEELLGKE